MQAGSKLHSEWNVDTNISTDMQVDVPSSGFSRHSRAYSLAGAILLLLFGSVEGSEMLLFEVDGGVGEKICGVAGSGNSDKLVGYCCLIWRKLS